MDSLAVSYAGELARFGIETSIIVPGAFTSGTNHFVHAGKPDDEKTLAAYETGPNATLGKEIMDGFARTAPPDADVSAVAEAVVHVVDLPFGKRPFRVHVDPANDGAEVVNGVADRVAYRTAPQLRACRSPEASRRCFCADAEIFSSSCVTAPVALNAVPLLLLRIDHELLSSSH